MQNFYDQENNRLRLRFPLRGPSVFEKVLLIAAPALPFNSHQELA